MSVQLSKEKQAEVTQSIVRFFKEKLELELTEFQATSLLADFFDEIAPFSYNEAVEDAQKQLSRLVEDLAGTCFQQPLTYWGRGERSSSSPEASDVIMMRLT